MLLNAERPEVFQIGERPIALDRDVDIDRVEPRPCLTVQQIVERRPPQHRDQRSDKEHQRQDAVVQRKNAQHAAHVEISEVIRLVAGVIQNARDQEAGQDEEQFDAVGSIIGDADDGPLDRIGRFHIAEEVKQQHHQDCEAAYAVEHRQVAMQVKPRGRARRGWVARRSPWCGIRRRSNERLNEHLASLSVPLALRQ